MEKRTGPNGPAAEEREQALAREIRVKDALIHEVHHRVKNNLQTVESLMRLHIRRCPSEEARSVLVEAAGRLRSMAIAHEMLSEATKEQVDAIELARRVSQQVKTSMCGDSSQFCIKVTGTQRIHHPRTNQHGIDPYAYPGRGRSSQRTRRSGNAHWGMLHIRNTQPHP